MSGSKRMVRIGVVGLQWGLLLAQQCQAAGIAVVAVCETNQQRLQKACAILDATPYQEYDAFLKHDMDGVILANSFDEHGPMALKALRAGKHVLSETAACSSIAEGIQLIRTVEATNLVYMLAADYPFKPYVREMHRLYQAGELGNFQYAECEYLHSWSPEGLAYFRAQPHYWRTRMSALAYCTHTITPIMYITATVPETVSAFVLPETITPEGQALAAKGRGITGIMMIHMGNGAYLKSLHGFLQGEQEPEPFWIRIHGTHGLMENPRRGDCRQVRLRKEAWAVAANRAEDVLYTPPDTHNEDLLVCEQFAHAIISGERPYFDVYRGIISSIVGICGMRSLFQNSVAIEVPDLRSEEVRLRYENDDWNGLVAPLSLEDS